MDKSRVAAPHVNNKALTEAEISEWRDEFPILARVIHCGNCSQSPQSKRVRAAIERYLDNWAGVGMDWRVWIAEVEEARKEFANLINCEPKDVSVVSSVSAAVSAIAGALPRNGRNAALATEMEFPTVGQVLNANSGNGLRVQFIPAMDGRIDPRRYEEAVTVDTAAVFMPHAFYESGYVQDIAKIAEICRAAGALLAVDAYQTLGTVPFDVRESKPHFVYSGNLKYLLGVPGIAFLYVDPAISVSLSPAATGWFGQRDPFAFKLKELDYAPYARRFDSGTPPVLAAFAAAEGMRVINEVGPDRIALRLAAVKGAGIAAAERHGLRIAGPPAPFRNGATIAVITETPPQTVERSLREEGIICSARGSVLRCAPHFFTTEEEVEKVMGRIARLDRA